MLQAATTTTPKGTAFGCDPITGRSKYLFSSALCDLARQSGVLEANSFTCKRLIDKNRASIDMRNTPAFIG
jgi:hypothetical protein